MVTNNERQDSPELVLKAVADSVSTGLRVAMPGIIQSFDAVAVTATIQPAVKASVRQPDGTVASVAMPLLVDVPVEFPRGGGVTLTFPIKPGDECVVEFADRCIDYWWQNGGVQEPVDPRQHHLADAFARVGPQSQAKKISGISTSAAQLRTDDGAAFIEINPGSHAVTVTTPGKLTASAQGGTEINSPEIVLNGNVTINGNLSQGMGAGGGTATMLGPVNVTNDVNAGGISLQTHKHSGVETGGGQTGGPE
ncbi:Gp138 family membrane-puncturing spike protein [Serratia plymuthica]|uniref:Gp138 family membrane-puncturing spike protein n=1 Tax=Serratia plymuthica TaxID=82996 RepID=UPI003DA2F100